MTLPNKAGRLTDDELKFIEQNAETMHYEDIARHVLRNPNTIKRYIEKKLGMKTSVSGAFQDDSVENSIKKSLIWKELQAQFTKNELDKFLYHWRRIITQFGSDIVATEEMQAVDYIKMDILMDRILTQQQQNLVDISELEKSIEAERKSPAPDFNKIDSWSEQISFRRTAQESVTKEYKELFKEKQNILKGMKATRGERIKHLENTKENIPDWIKTIIMSDSKRHEMGMYMEKMRLAMKAEEARLGQLHEYSDKIIQPALMTTETMAKIVRE